MATVFWKGPGVSRDKQGCTLKATVGPDGDIVAANQLASTQLMHGDVQVVLQMNLCGIPGAFSEEQLTGLRRVVASMVVHILEEVALPLDAVAALAADVRAAPQPKERDAAAGPEASAPFSPQPYWDFEREIPGEHREDVAEAPEGAFDRLIASFAGEDVLMDETQELALVAQLTDFDDLLGAWEHARTRRDPESAVFRAIVVRCAEHLIATQQGFLDGYASEFISSLHDVAAHRVRDVLEVLDDEDHESVFEQCESSAVRILALECMTNDEYLADVVSGVYHRAHQPIYSGEERRAALQRIMDLTTLEDLAQAILPDDLLAAAVQERLAAVRSGHADVVAADGAPPAPAQDAHMDEAQELALVAQQTITLVAQHMTAERLKQAVRIYSLDEVELNQDLQMMLDQELIRGVWDEAAGRYPEHDDVFARRLFERICADRTAARLSSQDIHDVLAWLNDDEAEQLLACCTQVQLQTVAENMSRFAGAAIRHSTNLEFLRRVTRTFPNRERAAARHRIEELRAGIRPHLPDPALPVMTAPAVHPEDDELLLAQLDDAADAEDEERMRELLRSFTDQRRLVVLRDAGGGLGYCYSNRIIDCIIEQRGSPLDASAIVETLYSSSYPIWRSAEAISLLTQEQLQHIGTEGALSGALRGVIVAHIADVRSLRDILRTINTQCTLAVTVRERIAALAAQP